METLRQILSPDFLLRNSVYTSVLIGFACPLVGVFLVLAPAGVHGRGAAADFVHRRGRRAVRCRCGSASAAGARGAQRTHAGVSPARCCFRWRRFSCWRFWNGAGAACPKAGSARPTSSPPR